METPIITVEDAAKAKRQLESDLVDRVFAFEKETGLHVHGLTLMATVVADHERGTRSMLHDLTADVRL